MKKQQIEGERYVGHTSDLTVREIDSLGNVHVQVHNDPNHENLILDPQTWAVLAITDDLNLADEHDFRGVDRSCISRLPDYLVGEYPARASGAYRASTGIFVEFEGSWQSRTGEQITALNSPCPVGFL